MSSLRIILLCVLAAVVYGVAHDQITARVCVEYFTVAHPDIFGTTDPTLLGLGWGVIATWWVGLLLGVPLAVAARADSRHKREPSSLLRPVACLLATMAACAAVAGVIGWALGSTGAVYLLEPFASGIPKERHAAFLGVACAHGASYLVGAVGGIAVIAVVGLSRNVTPARSADAVQYPERHPLGG